MFSEYIPSFITIYKTLCRVVQQVTRLQVTGSGTHILCIDGSCVHCFQNTRDRGNTLDQSDSP